MTARVASIHRYPVKSLIGEDLDVVTVGERGLVGDRGYALVDADDGIVASAKQPAKWAGLLSMSARYLAEPSAEPDADHLPPVEITLAGGGRIRSDDPDVDAVLSAAIGRSVRLAVTPPSRAASRRSGRSSKAWPHRDSSTASGPAPTPKARRSARSHSAPSPRRRRSSTSPPCTS